MSTEFFNDQWRIPSNENQNKVSNYSMEFDSASSDYIDLGTSFNSMLELGDSFSISMWVNIKNTASDRAIISNTTSSNIGIHLRVLPDESVRAIILQSNAIFLFVDSSPLAIDTWHNIIFTYDGSATIGGLNLYTNSLLNNNNTGTGGTITTITSTDSLKIGKHKSGMYFNGKLDQVTVFDYALSATQVSTLYGGGTAITNPLSLSPKPIAYYQLGDQSVYNGANYLVPNNSLSDYVFNFDGTDDSIDLGSTDVLINYAQSFSFSAWVKLDSYSNSTYPGIAKLKTNTNKSWFIFLSNSTNYLGLNFGAESGFARVKTAGNISGDFIGQWKHVCVTFDGVNYTASSSYKVYIDSSPVSLTASYLFGSVPNSSSLGYVSTSSNAFDGLISNVSIFSTELSSTQVETIYNNGAPNDISSLSPVGWYKLNAADTFDGSNWTIKDYGSGGNDGTSSGMTSASLITSDLQQTSGHSPYALSLDGVDDYLDCGNITALNSQSSISTSAWINYSGTLGSKHIFISGGTSSSDRFYVQLLSSTQIRYGSGSAFDNVTTSTISSGSWHHIVTVHNGTSLDVYLDGVKQNSSLVTVVAPNANIGNDFTIGKYVLGGFEWNGQLSNVALWNTNLSSTEITEIFNEGSPSDLHNFSGTAPVAWWQLGSNSSYNAGAWTCLDEIGTNNAVSAGSMTNDDIVDGVGYSASGLGTSSIDIKGDAPYSTANGLSENMDVLDRSTDIPS